MKKFVAGALLMLVSPVTIEAISQEANEVAEMRPTIIEGVEAENFNGLVRYFAARGVKHFSTGLISFMTEIEGERCRKTQVLTSDTHKTTISADFADAFSELRCVPSSDGYSLPTKGFYFGWMFLRDYDFSTLEHSTDGELSRAMRRLMDPANIFDPSLIDKQESDCDGRCSSLLALAALFAKANFYDSAGLATTAALWRDIALSASRKSEVVRRVVKDQIKYHLYKQYKYAVTTADYGLASWINDEVKNRNFADAEAEKIHAHFDGWKASEEKRDSALGVTFNLAEQNPLSSLHAAGLRYLNSNEVGLTVESGEINFAFLNCTDTDQRVQVQLNHKDHRAWRIPESWGDCELYLLGEEATKVTLWEYPAGTVDENGNLSI